MTERVSVITPSYNQGRFIERTIRSVLCQDVAHLEYLVFDGGSNDETVGILKKYDGSLSWTSEPDNGQADAVNKGLRACRGEIIGWLNSDDIYYPGAIRAACEYLARHPEIDVIYGDANHIDENDHVLAPYPTEAWDFQRLTETCFICQPAVFFRRCVFDRFGLLDPQEQWCMDYDYWLRLGCRGARFGWLRQVLAGSRMYAQNKTLGSRIKIHAAINSVLRRHLGRVPDRWLFNYAHVVADSRNVPHGNNFRFAAFIALHSWIAALRWNRRISSAMLSTTMNWVQSGWQARLHANRF